MHFRNRLRVSLSPQQKPHALLVSPREPDPLSTYRRRGWGKVDGRLRARQQIRERRIECFAAADHRVFQLLQALERALLSAFGLQQFGLFGDHKMRLQHPVTRQTDGLRVIESTACRFELGGQTRFAGQIKPALSAIARSTTLQTATKTKNPKEAPLDGEHSLRCTVRGAGIGWARAHESSLVCV